MAVQMNDLDIQLDDREPPRQDGFTPLRLFGGLLAAFQQHVAEEAESVAAYRRLGNASGDPVVGLLMRLVADDEDRHHDLLVRIAATVRSVLSRTDSLDSLPRGEPTAAPPGELLAVTRTFIREEREGARRLRRLALQTSGLHGGLPKLLLETMALDSEKHERILRFILRRLERRQRTTGRGGWSAEEDGHGAA